MRNKIEHHEIIQKKYGVIFVEFFRVNVVVIYFIFVMLFIIYYYFLSSVVQELVLTLVIV